MQLYKILLRYVLPLILLSAVSFAEDKIPLAQQIIHQMLEANRRINYEGVFVYRHHNEMDTVRIIHKVDGNNIQERIISLTGSAREVIRKKDIVTCILPDDESTNSRKEETSNVKNKSVT